MAIALQVGIEGTVSQPHVFGTVVGDVTSPDPVTNTVVGTVARQVVNAFEQPDGSGTFYYRVRLGEEWIPESELSGSFTVDRQIDAHTVSFELGLSGSRWSIFATERTWTRTRVEIHRWLGESASEMRALEPLVGYVLTARQAHEPEPVLRIRCGDRASLHERSTVCLELPPFAGQTRGQIVAAALLSAGITDFDVPPGAVYPKAVQAIDEPLFDWLKDFFEPEGWAIRWRGERLEIYRPELVRPPLPPDATWTADGWLRSSAAPSRDLPSTWILRGTSPVVVADENGLETTVTKTEVVAPYSRKYGVSRQVGGDVELIEPTGIADGAVFDQVISRLVDTQVTRGGQLVEQITEEFAWYNPGAARRKTDLFTNGYAWLDAYIDRDGRFVRWLAERFHLVAKEVRKPFYNADGTLEKTKIERFSYNLRTRGVGPQATADITVTATYVHADGQSYDRRWESWEKLEEEEIRYEYDPASGARWRETQDTSRYYAPKVRVNEPRVTGWYMLDDGTAQKGLEASWRQVESKITTKTLSRDDATVLGEAEARFGYHVPETAVGENDFGDRQSNAEEESFGFLERATKRYDVLSNDQVEIERREPGQTPSRETLLGGRPLPAFQASAWTRLEQQPLEVLILDPLALEWFGQEVRVLQSEHVQSTAEALAVIERRRRRERAPKVEIERPLHWSELGETVEVIDPPSGLRGRGLVVSIRETWDMAKAEFTAVYILEIAP